MISFKNGKLEVSANGDVVQYGKYNLPSACDDDAPVVLVGVGMFVVILALSEERKANDATQ